MYVPQEVIIEKRGDGYRIVGTLTKQQTAALLGIPRKRVAQIERMVLQKVRDANENNHQ